MSAFRPPRVKVCCVRNVHEAELVVDAGAAAIGLVTSMPSGQERVISEADAAAIVRATPSHVATVLLTSRTAAAEIAQQCMEVGPSAVQLADQISPKDLQDLRALQPATRLIQTIHVADGDAPAQARRIESLVDALLLDSGSATGPTKELGGTGRTHDWSISAAIRQTSTVPVILAGGLNPTNVAEAIHAVRPRAVDVCSGLRHNVHLDPDLLRAFMMAVQQTSHG